jgi:hypothetical protein
MKANLKMTSTGMAPSCRLINIEFEKGIFIKKRELIENRDWVFEYWL